MVVPEATVIVIVDDVPLDGFGEKLVVEPAGWPLADSETAPAKPPVRVIVTVYVAVPPLRRTETEPGLTESEKSPLGGGGGGGGAPKSECRSRFGDPVPALVILFGVALSFNALSTAAGVAEGFASRYRAATPATCGAAIEVPLIVFVAVLLVYHAEVMLEPGAKMSTQVPMLEKEERASVEVDEATVIAAGTRARVLVQASPPVSFPAEIAYVTPSAMELLTALSTLLLAEPPRLIFATAGWPAA